MAWNTPGSGSGGDNGNRPWPPRRKNDNPLGEALSRLRNLFDGNGGGFLGVAAVILGLLLLFSTFQLIGEQQRGVVLRFGQFDRIMQPGPNFKWPWPIESVTKVDATSVRSFSQTVPVLTNDENIVTVSLNVQYRIADAREYLFGSRAADEVVRQAAQSAVREQVGRAGLDTVLGARGPLAVSARERLQASLDTYRTGLVVTELNLPDARPPEEVKPAFDAVNSAQQEKDRLVNEAGAYAARIVPEARGEASRLRTEAEGYKLAVIAKSEGDASRFTQLHQQYKSSPEVTRKRLWLETVQGVLADNRKVIGGDGRQLIYVPMPASGTPAGTTPVLPAQVLPALEQNAPAGNAARSPRPAGREEVTR